MTSHRITISASTHHLLEQAARRDREVKIWDQSAIRHADGSVTFEIEEDVYTLLAALDPNDMDNAVKMACTKQFGRA